MLLRQFHTARVRPVIAFTALAILWVASACTEEPPAGPGPYPAALAILTVPVEPLAVGDTLRLAAEVHDQHGSPIADRLVAWSSDNTEVATVSPSGTVTMVGRGTARITATAGGASGSIQLQATDPAYAVLAVLHFVTDGENWTNSDNWLEDDDLGTWYGVDTDTAGNVVGLSLDGNNLDGRIPPELGDLRSLLHLNLSDNELGGGIPGELGDLRNLRELYLHNNDLSGEIPSYLGNLKNLSELYLHNNDLSGEIPSYLGNLRNLHELYLHSNDLSGEIPPDLGNLAQLRRLNLNHNDLTGQIPPELGDLAHLERLYLGSNELHGTIPPELGGLLSLQWLWLANNDLYGAVPSELGRLGASMRVLWLSNNDLEGRVPSQLGELQNLAWLLLGGNEDLSGALPLSLTGLPLSIFGYEDTSLCELPDREFQEWLDSIPIHNGTGEECPPLTDREILEILYDATAGPGWLNSGSWLTDRPLGRWWGVQTDTAGRVVRLQLIGNRLTGRIPRELGGLENLQYVNLRGNALTGEIPPQLGELTNLESLALSYNTLTGEIPPEMGELGKLENLEIGNNALTGEIPPALGRLENLQFLYLDGNALTGGIPPELGELKNLLRLVLFGNTLTGEIPPELEELENLESLWLSGNSLTGRIPPELGELENLEYLDLASNGLTGEIPAELGELGNLRHLRLHYNSLSDEIPPELGELENLQVLNLYSNSLTGEIPMELGELANLQNLELSGNSLTGEIPPELGDLTNLEFLSLAYNGLTGEIPPELGELENLRYLWIHSNSLTGEIPPELGELANLRHLFLSRNALTGEIPPELGNLGDLWRMSLEWNSLTGEIPAELGDLYSLQYLMLNDNSLTGEIPAELGDLYSLQYLFLNDNSLTGEIPGELGELANLQYLHLHYNSLSDEIPSWLGDLGSLRELTLAQNEELSGALPMEFTDLNELQVLQAGDTELCAPPDADFQAWLATVPIRRVAACGTELPRAYLTQAVQSREFPVPVVGGERALLRVFLTADTTNNEDIPGVEVVFYEDGDEIHSQYMAGKAGPIPTEVDEGDLGKSVNAEIAAKWINKGIEMVIEVDSVDVELGVPRRIPETGRLAVDVREMPSLDLTTIPFLWDEDPDSAILAMTEAMAEKPESHALLEHTRTLLPVEKISAADHEPVLSTTNNARQLLYQTRAIRVLEGGTGHYLGMMSGEVTGAAGVAFVPGRSSFSIPSATVIAHELGHNMHLWHAPCGGAGGPDPMFPYPDGSSGAWGYDFDGDSLVSPETPDLMSYCGPKWISDYHFTNALGWRLHDEGYESRPAATAVPMRSLLLWGGTDARGDEFLFPAFVVNAPPTLPDSVGEHSLTGRNADGDELFSLAFAMDKVADGDGESFFVYILPVESEWTGALASLTLSGPSGTATLDGESDSPMSILRDPRTGQVRAILAGPTERAVLLAETMGVDVRTSRGVPSRDAWR